jgi:hypothetical protein
MTVSYSEAELLAFIDYLSSKSLLPSATASGRKAAALKILAALDPEEKTDLRNLDVEQTFQRFSNKFGKEFTPQSLITYKSRFNSVLSDFLKYHENLAGYKTGITKKQSKENGSETKVSNKKSSAKDAGSARVPPPPTEPKSYVLQIPISNGTLVEIRNLPMDLTEADATKIAAVIKAHAPS